MKTSRIDLIALNGATGEHYKYEEVADIIAEYLLNLGLCLDQKEHKQIIRILVENFPDDKLS